MVKGASGSTKSSSQTTHLPKLGVRLDAIRVYTFSERQNAAQPCDSQGSCTWCRFFKIFGLYIEILGGGYPPLIFFLIY